MRGPGLFMKPLHLRPVPPPGPSVLGSQRSNQTSPSFPMVHAADTVKRLDPCSRLMLGSWVGLPQVSEGGQSLTSGA